MSSWSEDGMTGAIVGVESRIRHLLSQTVNGIMTKTDCARRERQGVRRRMKEREEGTDETAQRSGRPSGGLGGRERNWGLRFRREKGTIWLVIHFW
jgi:hypothetical protein